MSPTKSGPQLTELREWLEKSRDGKRDVVFVEKDGKDCYEVHNDRGWFVADCRSMFYTASVIAALDPDTVRNLLDVAETAREAVQSAFTTPLEGNEGLRHDRGGAPIQGCLGAFS